jgi:hypothetical protein
VFDNAVRTELERREGRPRRSPEMMLSEFGTWNVICHSYENLMCRSESAKGNIIRLDCLTDRIAGAHVRGTSGRLNDQGQLHPNNRTFPP